MKLRTALLAATVLAVPAAVQAQPISGLYIGAGAGYNWLTQEKVETTAIPGSLKADFNGGFVGVASVGYGLGNGLRFEVEGNFRENTLQNLKTSLGQFNAGGNEQKIGAMFNVLYDFQLPYVQPYIGVGGGYAWTYWQNVKAYNAANTVSATADDWNGGGAYQVIAGLAVPIPQLPGLAITAEYRFFSLFSDQKYHGAVETPTTFVHTTLKSTNNYNNSVLLGVRYAFNAAPPPPPAPAPVAAPAPAPARTYLVFFDWDKYNLTDRAVQIVKEAADASTHVQYTRIQVNGYTDTSGTPAYNQRLSVKRANSVAAELVKDGVPKSAIAIQGFGETHLLVPTGPGVREPQNRRVEIIIQ